MGQGCSRACSRFWNKYILCRSDEEESEDLIVGEEDEDEEVKDDKKETTPKSPKKDETSKVEEDSEDETSEDDFKYVLHLFDYYSAFAGDKKGEISLRAIDKWFEHAGLFKGKKIQKDDTAILFAKKTSPGKKMTDKQFIEMLKTLAKDKEIPTSEITEKLLSAGKPQDSTITTAITASTVDELFPSKDKE